LGYSYFRRDDAETALIAEVEHTQSEDTAAEDGEAEEREPFCKIISRCTEWVKNLRILHLPGILLERQRMYESGGSSRMAWRGKGECAVLRENLEMH
jgi:hypothetical protein